MFCFGIYCWYQSVFIFFTGWCDSYQGSSVCSLPLWVVKLKIRINVTELLFQKFTSWSFPGQVVQQCIIHSQSDGSHTTLLTRSLYVTSQFRASTNKMMFWWVVKTHTEFVPDESTMTHHLRRRVQNLENPTFTSGFLSLNATNN